MIHIAAEIRLGLAHSFWEKNVSKYDEPYDIRADIFSWITMIPKSGNKHISKILETHISGIKKHFSLIFLQIFSKLFSTFNNMFQFKIYGTSYGLVFESRCVSGG